MPLAAGLTKITHGIRTFVHGFTRLFRRFGTYTCMVCQVFARPSRGLTTSTHIYSVKEEQHNRSTIQDRKKSANVAKDWIMGHRAKMRPRGKLEMLHELEDVNVCDIFTFILFFCIIMYFYFSRIYSFLCFPNTYYYSSTATATHSLQFRRFPAVC